MRVLHIYTGNLYGGIESVLSTLGRCRDFCPEMEPHFALCFNGRLSNELKSYKAPLYDLGPVRARNLLLVRNGRRRLAQIIAEQRIDIAICHAVWSQVIFGSAIQNAGVRQVFWLHDAMTGHGWLGAAATLVNPDFVVTNSNFSASTLLGAYPQIPRKVVRYPLELPHRTDAPVELPHRNDAHVEPAHRSDHVETRRTVREQLGTRQDTTVIAQLSRLEPYKGHEHHLKALAHLKDVPNWECWMIGGPQRPHEMDYFVRLKRLAETLGIQDHVRFLGQRDDPARLLAAADIHCQPNIGPEPFGMTFIEGLAAGLPVVTTKLGAAEEIIDKSCGVLVEPGDVEQLASALERLIRSPSARRELGAAGPGRAAKLCDAKSQLNMLSDTLRGLLVPNLRVA